MDGLQELWDQLPEIEVKIRAALPFPTEGIWTWLVGLLFFTVIVTVTSSAAGWAAAWLYRRLTRR